MALTFVFLLSACATAPLEKKGPRIAEAVAKLPEVTLPEVRVPPPTRADVMAAYRRIYGTVPDARDNQAVGKRLANLEMRVGEENDIAGLDEPYRAAIALYEELLAKEGGENRDEILYQLARAHDVVGNSVAALAHLDRLIAEHPASKYAVEAHFRRGEMAFSQERYASAALDYGYVVDHGADSQYWRNSNYMLGWCRFKQGDLDLALESFFVVAGGIFGQGDELDRGTQELLDDALRVTVLATTYLDGPKTLASHMQRLGKPSWQHQVYERLAEEYKTRERFLDSVATLETFIEENSLDRRAPVFHQRVIDTLIAADFPSEIRPRKEDFIARYGVRSQFWQVHPNDARAEYLPILKTYLTELSRLNHSEAQTSGVAADYLEAADYYEQIVTTFPDDPAIAESLFLLGEVYTEADRPRDAVAAFQRVVREHPTFEKANEAGYAAVLGLTEVLSSVDGEERARWQRVRIDAQIEFAMTFPGDGRSAAVQADAADELFELGQFGESMELASHLLRTRSDLEPKLARTALLIMGHGEFELGSYAAAEAAYRQLLALPDVGESNAAVEEKLLAAIFKQAEAAEAAGSTDVAVDHYLRIAKEAPGSELAAKGHFDAVAAIEGEGRWGEAAQLLAEFRSTYANNELAADAPKRLASLYEKSGDIAAAAIELRGIATTDADPEVRRQALYRAGEMFLEIDDITASTAAFRDYANAYPIPVDLSLEAIHHLDLLSQRMQDESSRRVWLAKKVELADRQGSLATDRMKVLAAEAQFIFAADERRDFDAITLSNPLKKSLQLKTSALKRTVAAFEKAAGYGVQQYATASNFQIADLYAALSRSVLDSARPAGLSELELEQYEILLEEQAFPFEEQAIALHEINAQRSWSGVYDEWVQRSFAALKALNPGRFDREELEVTYVHSIH